MTTPLRHLLALDQLSRPTIEALLDHAQALRPMALVGDPAHRPLAGRSLANLFFEASTRTRCSFQLAAVRLGADVLNVDMATSSARKGESMTDTLATLEAMGVTLFSIRHSIDGVVAELANVCAPTTRLINAGDGRSHHPTQGLLDMLTIRQNKGTDFSGLKVAILGDLKHSRVARSDLHALRALGTGEIALAAPAALLPDAATAIGCRIFENADDAIRDADVIITLRLQRERMDEGLVPSLEAFYNDWGLSPQRLLLARKDAIVMHPGPMNRGVEIADEVADGPQSVIREQVSNGVAVRMAVLEALGGAPATGRRALGV
ncbi:MAG: aspartate carbamoyltransferase catalytic subunit, partial [Pseudomarimonas sp.]